MTLDDVGPGVTTQRYHNNRRLIMLEVKSIKFSLDIQNFLGIIMCEFHASQSRTEGMATSVCVFLEHTSYIYNINTYTALRKGAQWLSGRVLDSRPKGRGFEPHRRHCVVVLEQDTFILA